VSLGVLLLLLLFLSGRHSGHSPPHRNTVTIETKLPDLCVKHRTCRNQGYSAIPRRCVQWLGLSFGFHDEDISYSATPRTNCKLLRQTKWSSINDHEFFKVHNFCCNRPLLLLTPGAKRTSLRHWRLSQTDRQTDRHLLLYIYTPTCLWIV
jgi:hypothetical protein